MTRASSPPPSAKACEFEPGDQAKTPSGAIAEVVAVYPNEGEALVQWTNGDRARFRFGYLKKWPDA